MLIKIILKIKLFKVEIMSFIIYSIMCSIMIGVDDSQESFVVSLSAESCLDHQDYQIVVVSTISKEKKLKELFLLVEFIFNFRQFKLNRLAIGYVMFFVCVSQLRNTARGIFHILLEPLIDGQTSRPSKYLPVCIDCSKYPPIIGL